MEGVNDWRTAGWVFLEAIHVYMYPVLIDDIGLSSIIQLIRIDM